jgi:hypothetical protein
MIRDKHCEDFIRDKTQPECLRRFIRIHRWPATWYCRMKERGMEDPKLYATVATATKAEEHHINEYGIRSGDRVKVVMASRMGDLGVTKNLSATCGYEVRLYVEWLKDFSETP